MFIYFNTLNQTSTLKFFKHNKSEKYVNLKFGSFKKLLLKCIQLAKNNLKIVQIPDLNLVSAS